LFEHRRESLIPTVAYIHRLARYIAIAAGIVCISLAVGVIGYHTFEGLSWIDSLLNASMILGGMGPVNQLRTSGGKIFASLYALYSGIVFLFTTAVVMAPVLHRFLHRFHIEEEIRTSMKKRKP
jgi:hypothetical protein